MQTLFRVILLLSPLMVLAQSESKKDWKIFSADSHQPGEGVPQHVIDGDPATFWHTHWSNHEEPPHPHEVAIDMGRSAPLAGFVYVPRQPKGNGAMNGRIDHFQYLTSADGTNWNSALRGHFTRGAARQTNLLSKTVTARYFKLISWSAFDAQPWACVAELDIVPANP